MTSQNAASHLGLFCLLVAVGAGFADGLGYGDNTKAAVIRLGLMEMVKFCEVFYHGMFIYSFKPDALFMGHRQTV